MRRSILSFVLLLSVFASFSPAQRDLEKEEIKVEKATPPPVRPPLPRRPRGPVVRTNGVLVVNTYPLTANVVIKNSRGGTPKQYQTQDGELQVELLPGTYDIEVTAAKYYPFTDPQTKGILIRPSQITTRRANLKPTTGSIIIGLGSLEYEATAISIDNNKPVELNITVNVKKEENQVELEDVPEGVHALRIANPDYAVYEKDKLQVEGGSKVTVTPRFKPAVVNFIIRSQPGVEIYVDGRLEGRVEPNGELRISGKYKPGTHTIRAENEKERFEPAQTKDNFGIGDATVELKLKHIKSSPEFAEYFNTGLSFWDAPNSWRVDRGKMIVRTSEVGLVRNQVWDDFKMEFDVSLTNGRGAAWIVRARDKKNYYLFQLSGPNGTNPSTFRTYIYNNGQPTLLRSVPVVEELGSQKDQLHITVEAKGPTIRNFIKHSEHPTPDSELLGVLMDATAISYGTVGLVAIDNEEFTIYFVNVTPDGAKSH